VSVSERTLNWTNPIGAGVFFEGGGRRYRVSSPLSPEVVPEIGADPMRFNGEIWQRTGHIWSLSRQFAKHSECAASVGHPKAYRFWLKGEKGLRL